MQYFRPGSQLRQLITMLSIVGEYPIRSLYLLGNERAYKALVHKLTTPETFRIPQTETELTTRLLTVTGKGNSRSVRFYKGALHTGLASPGCLPVLHGRLLGTQIPRECRTPGQKPPCCRSCGYVYALRC